MSDLGKPKASQQVLLVENEEAIRESLALYLTSKGFAVVEAKDGREALWTLMSRPGPYLALVTDLDMPHMDGEQLVLEVDAREINFGAYLIISAYGRGHPKVENLLAARLRCPIRLFEKPFIFDELLAALMALPKLRE